EIRAVRDRATVRCLTTLLSYAYNPNNTMLFSFLFLALGFVPPQAQSSYVLRGTVVASTAETMDHVEVVLERGQEHVIAKTVSDSNGAFEFRNLEAGRYEVVVRIPGYDEARETAEIVSPPLDPQIAAALAEGVEIPPGFTPTVSGPVNVYVLIHKKGTAP